MKNIVFLPAAAIALLAGVASPACAQVALAAPSASAPAANASSVKLFGDWGVRCFAAPAHAPCEMQEAVTEKKNGARILGVSIALAPAQGRYIFQLAVPLGVSLAKGAKIEASNYSAPAMAYRRCDRGGCYVEGLIDGKVIDALARSAPSAKVEIAAMDGRTVDLPFSLRGFADARKDMEERSHGKPTKP